ncbi:bifunctional diaminohydroxyphosphoribosylaminopyrimidine deaminase/5-amino-6-(5-phosphoribosylamino)uracil reductase RibD [Fastidiosibacter lacustris]|uniref:bifunctional diaminohydroxyphosphoribosylaminopyrimidine deaminase/5-amino-6-(5-phosphoribosylamino)uracil reductase RibD n=1 Tax=Fastidiosibacter lacustris TaxID=2056695 RepID=UPI0013004819|nr:bifunctional diaminohydroxyphosphoribosylaminopyrimidine deaminase/5-amino-6-(5-phosphoribosylamino)uracil reductase RibD [Fastidiosibacter lacustris]
MFQADQFYMQQALMLAKRGCLSVSPNPMVGCVIVKNGCIIGEGWHEYAGGNHAELNALIAAGEKAKGSCVYVTLEPCCHVGRTGACTEALIKAEVKKVVIASIDPNQLVAGKGINHLQQVGIEVIVGLLQQEAARLNKIFFYYHQTKLPYVITKWGMSLDGELQVKAGDVKQITNKASQKMVHNLRNQLDAIMVGHNTVVDDDPRLTVRMSDSKIIKHPLRVVISKSADLPIDAHVFNTAIVPTILFTSQYANPQALEALKSKNVECIVMPLNSQQKIDLKQVLKVLADKGITSLLVEGGRTLLNNFFSEGLVNEVHSFIAPVIINGCNKKQTLDISEQNFIASDYYCKGEIR